MVIVPTMVPAPVRRSPCDSGVVADSGTSAPKGALLARRYRLGTQIGQGGVGTVHEAIDEETERRVAIKVLHSYLAGDPTQLSRFEREARAATALSHPNMVRVLDFRCDAGEPPFLVMDLLVGMSLRDLLKETPRVPVARVAIMTAQILSALAAAHRANIVHRDIKPANIFVCAGSPSETEIVKVLDFGIAKLLQNADRSLTRSGEVLGTLAYMAPEQAQGQNVDARTDLYSVGVLMYEAAAGRRPFEASSAPALVASMLAPHVPLCTLCPDVPPAFGRVVDRALQKHPDARFATAEEMAIALMSPTTGA